MTSLGHAHAQATLQSTEEFLHFSWFSLKVLHGHLACQVNLSGGDPLMASAAAVLGAESQVLTLPPEAQPSTSWGETLDTVDPLDSSGYSLMATPLQHPPAGY